MDQNDEVKPQTAPSAPAILVQPESWPKWLPSTDKIIALAGSIATLGAPVFDRTGLSSWIAGLTTGGVIFLTRIPGLAAVGYERWGSARAKVARENLAVYDGSYQQKYLHEAYLRTNCEEERGHLLEAVIELRREIQELKCQRTLDRAEAKERAEESTRDRRDLRDQVDELQRQLRLGHRSGPVPGNT